MKNQMIEFVLIYGSDRMTNEWYTLKKILKQKADYYVIYGQRSNGKTYSVLQFCLENHYRLAYIRRMEEDIKKYNISDIFNAHQGEWKNGDYNDITYKARRFYYCKRNDNGEIIKQDKESMCDVFSLNSWERSKGQDRGKFDVICLDEFIADTCYLPNEPQKFKQLLSSLIRNRDNVIIFLLGNSVNTYSPYFDELNITDIVDAMKEGEIRTKVIGEFGTKIAIEYAESSAKTKKVRKFFEYNGKKSMITSGVWEIDEYPHLYETIEKRDIIQTAYVINDNFNFAIDIVNPNDNLYLRVRPFNKEIDVDNCIVYSKIPSPNMLHSTSIFNPRNKVHRLILELINQKQVFFTDNRTGDKWENYLKISRQNNLNIVYKLY